MNKLKKMDKLLNDIAVYLSRQPYVEVAGLIQRISNELQNMEINKKIATDVVKEEKDGLQEKK